MKLSEIAKDIWSINFTKLIYHIQVKMVFVGVAGIIRFDRFVCYTIVSIFYWLQGAERCNGLGKGKRNLEGGIV